MSNFKINLSDLKESNINQLVATEMLMIRGGCGRRNQSRSNKCSSFTRGSYSKKSRVGKCSTGAVGTPSTGSYVPPTVVAG